MVTLAGARTQDELTEAMVAEITLPSGSPDIGKYERALLDALPGDRPRLAYPLQPDLIGEAFVLEVLREKSPDQQQNTILRWHAHWPRSVEDALIRIIQDFGERPRDMAVADWFMAVIAALTNINDLIGLADRMPEQTVNLREAAAHLQKRIASELRANTGIFADDHMREIRLVQALNNPALRLSDIGDFNDAIIYAREAVDLSRAALQFYPDTFRSILSTVLDTLFYCFDEAGRRRKALAAITESVEILRSLAKEKPEIILPDLAKGLNNLRLMPLTH